MTNLEITIYGGIVVAIVTIFVLTPLRNYLFGLFKRFGDSKEELSNSPNIVLEEMLSPKDSSITSMEKSHAISFEEARRIAQEKSDADLEVWRAESRTRIEASLLTKAKELLESGEISSFEEAKKLAKELSDAELEIWRHGSSANIKRDLLESAKRIIEDGEARTFEEAKKIAQQKSDAELEVWRAESRARMEKELLDATKKIINGSR